MKIFRKLIRDRIPEIIAAKGERAVTRVLNDEEFAVALENKLLEEVQEMRLGDNKAEEIADIYEVLDALIRARGFSAEEIMRLKDKKRAERGGFEKKLLLEGTQ
ncbi:phosphoribosyl-ATP pyrophosphohydrolase [Candidatus Parcubacteria bacterium]|nr:MAG: phosphoribosyl-ATP pyrophosphohydrolase [Candidatus Parcubacteria bacterium]